MSFTDKIKPITMGPYTVRLAKNEEELKAFKDLRYKYLICGFDPSKYVEGETDENIGYDKTASQLIAIHKNSETKKTEVVGGYVLMRYKTKDDFCKVTMKYDLTQFLKKHMFNFLEISRAVVHPDHRNGGVSRLLFAGIGAYCAAYNLRYAGGTMSFLGLDPDKYIQAASYLYHHYRMDENIMVRPLDINGSAYYHKYLPLEKVNRVEAVAQLPGMLKGLIMMGSKVGEGFYIDKDLRVVETFALLDTTCFDQTAKTFGSQRFK